MKVSVKKPERVSSVLFMCDSSSKGEAVVCSSMMGKFIYDLAPSNAGVVAYTKDGVYLISTGERVNGNEFIASGCGSTFSTGLSPEGSLFSWGKGPTGELGQGLLFQDVNVPLRIQSEIEFVELSSGEFHSLALDGYGNAYSWGQNFDKQLGLYTKDKSQMKGKNCMIESLTFVPRFIPLSLQAPIAKVCCGSKFSVLLSRSGDLWTFGAGESGQLGTGRCTMRDVPEKVPMPASAGRIVAVSCGWAHVLAVDEKNSVYSWGFNRRGQLGLGHTSTGFQPREIPQLRVSKVFAHHNSSAAISPDGRLFTWGNGDNHRLMQGHAQHLLEPAVVVSLGDNVVHSFSFAPTASAAMVLSRLNSLEPLSGPQKTFSRLDISGCGFWQSDDIIVKFTCKGGSGFAAPRSCPGTLLSAGVVTCRPPRLGEAGLYEVSVSMDGVVFLADTLLVNVYKDFTISDLSPALIDRRFVTRCQFTVMAKGINQIPAGASIFVRVSAASTPQGTTDPTSSIIITVPGTLVDDPAAANDVPAANSSLASKPETPQLTTSSTDDISKNKKPEVAPLRAITFDVDLGALGDPDRVSFVNVQIALNGRDFCAFLPEEDLAVMHSFQPKRLVPDCFALGSDEDSVQVSSKTPRRGVVVHGSSFISTSLLPARYRMEAVFRCPLGEVSVPITCEGEQSFQLYPPALSQFSGSSSSSSSATATPTMVNSTVRFQLVECDDAAGGGPTTTTTAASGAASKSTKKGPAGASSASVSSVHSHLAGPQSLSSKELSLVLYVPQAVSVQPLFCRRREDSVLVLQGLAEGGLRFKSPEVKVLLFRSDGSLSYLVKDVRMVSVSQPIESLFDPSNSSDNGSGDDGGNGEFKAVFQLPFYRPPAAAAAVEGGEAGGVGELENAVDDPPESFPDWKTVEYVMANLLLDGSTPVPPRLASRISFFDEVNIKAVPKGPAVPGTSLTIDVTGVSHLPCPDDEPLKCIVRVSADLHHAAKIDVPAQLSCREGKVTFVVPEASQLASIVPVEPGSKPAKGAGKNFFLGVSVDSGSSYDMSDKTLLQIK